ncbi:MAG: single-stranded DNA-binding protein [Candidatus Neomarinimicrobiota bacterium]|uniref:Single-stranded DNA-binding protein n=1 Tax=marine metagenome TaxID=408172 RepID=A0A381N5I5_9ZZZZ|nr:single-stranded DNA-binding protein [Candidatus Neomarinimicrobiota bacterium]MEC9273613.1 single-stranded DNA-binding protein [Candidatus Neomarinimicrobiota bacterium]MEE3195392.1 single-stranded DNA-binding protein [Candidatus Neomarinimicrobiota bacterium]|tara:strand:- start:214 stop:612 length:399 start_codon:yes stop_codon:yes gene_type:complete
MQKGSVNKVILVGHLGGDPESRFTPGGTAVATFSIATNESRKNSDGNWEDHTEWHRCVLFGKQAEFAGEYVKKGQMVYVEGRLQTRSWEDKEGMKRYSTEVVGNAFTTLGRRNTEGGGGSPAQPSNDDDLPF